jgi:hypothetical protein
MKCTCPACPVNICSFLFSSSLVSGKCQLGKSYCSDGVLNGHSSVMKSAVDPSMMGNVSSSVGLMIERHNHSNGLSNASMGIKLLKISSRSDIIPITGDKVHWLMLQRYAHFRVFRINSSASPLVCHEYTFLIL